MPWDFTIVRTAFCINNPRLLVRYASTELCNFPLCNICVHAPLHVPIPFMHLPYEYLFRSCPYLRHGTRNSLVLVPYGPSGSLVLAYGTYRVHIATVPYS